MEYFNLIFLPLHFQGLFPASGKNINLTIMKNNSVQILMLISDLELMFLLQSLVLLMPVKICNHFPGVTAELGKFKQNLIGNLSLH